MKIILSLTTTKKRLDIFYYGIQSLLKQTLKPDLFLINISKIGINGKTEFENVPNWLQHKSITINWVDDIGPYRKLIPALSYATDDDLIVTADDDMLYGANWLRDLVDAHNGDPDKIICTRARLMKKNLFGRWQNYNKWRNVSDCISDKLLIPIGAGGIVYSKKLLNLKFIMDDHFKIIAPFTDDLWFKMASFLDNVEIKVFSTIDLETKYIIHSLGLEKKNLRKKNNSSLVVKSVVLFFRFWIDYFGIRVTPNDKNWESIIKYVGTRYKTK